MFKGTGEFDQAGRVAVVGNYLPRSCGIATFTTDLCDALSENLDGHDDRIAAVVINDTPEGYDYPQRVRYQIKANQQLDYLRAAQYLNDRDFAAVFLQHEYGIFGGEDGSYILHLVQNLRVPLVTTLHTVLQEPSEGQRDVLCKIAECSEYVTVMSHKASELLEQVYGVKKDKVVFIPHGVPDAAFLEADEFKERCGVSGKKSLLTFGLLSPNKGIESMIRALPDIIQRHPDAVYIVLGRTHPHVKRAKGDSYRNDLQQLSRSLGVEENILFHNRFVELPTLVQYLLATDIYVTPYCNKEQIVSGTLAYAMGIGVATVSTPYWYAEELLSEGRGRLVPFGDHRALAEEVVDLLDNEEERQAIRKRCYQFSRPMVWKEVAREYLKLGWRIEQTAAHQKVLNAPTQRKAMSPSAHHLINRLPDIELDHLRILTDDTGILQHAVFSVPNRHEGYTVDDNARALIAGVLYHSLHDDRKIIALVQTYLSFVYHAFDRESGRFHNFMSYDRSWLDGIGSEDSHGRCVWALGTTVKRPPNERTKSLAARLFVDAFPAVEDFASLRALSFGIIGAGKYIETFGKDERIRKGFAKVAARLYQAFADCASMNWPWPEEVLSYSNAVLPHALLVAGRTSGDQKMKELGLRVLDWLLKIQTCEEGHLSVIGNDGWFCKTGKKAQFDQQPLEAKALVLACSEAFRATKQEKWITQAEHCFAWFLGRNDLGLPVYDFETGGCSDGIVSEGINLNQGAESTLAWLISLLTIYELTGVLGVSKREPLAQVVSQDLSNYRNGDRVIN